MRRTQSWFIAAFAACLVIIAMAFANAKNEHPDKHLEILLRNIGHQVLLNSSDSTSRVLPVQKLNDHTFRISFENSFGFTPDTLMNIIHSQLAAAHISKDYTVSVNECLRNQIIFAYEVNTSAGDLKPCRGRQQKKGCYIIEISFFTRQIFNYAWLLVLLVPLALLGAYFSPWWKNLETNDVAEEETVSGKDEPVAGKIANDNVVIDLNEETSLAFVRHKMIGSFRLDETKGILCLNDQTIELSDKEAKALGIFASTQNTVVDRDYLRKILWEDEGVIVINRNVDVLISKLRKKLSADPSISIVNVHGKGYKLVTG